MVQSYRMLWKAPYNKSHPARAIGRWLLWKLIRLFKIRNFSYRVWGDKKIFLNYDSFQSMWIMYNYWVDWEEFNLIKDIIRPEDQVADIGTNMGFYTIWFSKFVGFNGRIHAFEPDQENFSKLTFNCQLNLLEHVMLNNMAVGNQSGHIYFTTGLDGENHIATSIDKNTRTVPIIRLDDYCQEHHIEKIAYAKVDIEGFEYDFLSGASHLLSQKKIDIIQIEINEQIKHSGKSIHELLDLINRFEYSLCCYDIQNKKLQPISYSKERENYFLVADMTYSNQLLQP